MADSLWSQTLAHIRVRAALHIDDVPKYARRAGVTDAELRGTLWAMAKTGRLDFVSGYFVLAARPSASTAPAPEGRAA